MATWRQHFLDPLYGAIEFNDALVALIRTPIMQRLRHVRLSNIDSIDIPAIANLSRFEHSLGVAHLAGKVGFRAGLKSPDLLVLSASALLHDWSITSFGHLVEEGLQYVNVEFDHEKKLKEIIEHEGTDEHETGGAGLQIIVGRVTGLLDWARQIAGVAADSLIIDIVDNIVGRGRMGGVLVGEMDLDNLDNVFRMAWHMGLPVDREIPQRIACSMVSLTEQQPASPIFRVSAEPDIEKWLCTRYEVYQQLMLAERDFAGKLMMLYATVRAYEEGQITKSDWRLVDYEFMTLLSTSCIKDVREAVTRWIAGELWDCTPLKWMSGKRPEYTKLRAFSHDLTNALKRPCFAYGIKDKRQRELTISYDDGSQRKYGKISERWLLGVGSSRRKAFSTSELKKIFDLAQYTFDTEVIGAAHMPSSEDAQQWLI